MVGHALAALRALVCACVCVFACALPAAAQDDATSRTAAVLARPNDKAQRQHTIMLRFSDLPGPLASVSGAARFEVSNIDCVAIDHERAPGGVRLRPRHDQALAWQQHPDGTISARVFEDAYVDENYFKLGLCRWRLVSVTVRFASSTTAFAAALSLDEMRADASVAHHYLVRDFNAKPPAMDIVPGEAPAFYGANAGAQFVLTLSPRTP